MHIYLDLKRPRLTGGALRCALSLFVLILGSLGVSGCSIDAISVLPTAVAAPKATPRATSTLAPEAVYAVARGTVKEVVTVRGRIASAREVTLAFKLNGWIKTLDLAPGDLVTQGQVIAEIDAPNDKGRSLEEAVTDAEYDLHTKTLELQEAKSAPVSEQLLAAKARANQADIARQQAQADYDRIAWMGDAAGGRPEAVALQRAVADYEAALASLDATQASEKTRDLQIQRLQADVTYAQKQVAEIRDRMGEAQLKAPFSGVVISVNKRVGDTVSPYEAVASVSDPSRLQVIADVTENDISYVAVGQAVTITLAARESAPLGGRVVAIASQPTLLQGKNAYQTTMEFSDPSVVPVTSATGADVSLVTRVAQDVLVVPVAAIQSAGEGSFVEIVNSPARHSPVVTGITDGRMTEVVSGLSEGDKVRLPEPNGF